MQLYLMSLNNATNTDRYSALVKQEISSNVTGERPDVEKIQRYEIAMNALKASSKEHAKGLKRPYKYHRSGLGTDCCRARATCCTCCAYRYGTCKSRTCHVSSTFSRSAELSGGPIQPGSTPTNVVIRSPLALSI